jgi:hypothetical protein
MCRCEIESVYNTSIDVIIISSSSSISISITKGSSVKSNPSIQRPPLRIITHHIDNKLTRLMTGIFFAQVVAKTAANTIAPHLTIRGWSDVVAGAVLAIQSTMHEDAFYMPAAVALMQHYQS